MSIQSFRLNLGWHHRNLLLNVFNLILEYDCPIEISKSHKVICSAALRRDRTSYYTWLIASVSRVEVKVLIGNVS
jgi:hypothetical protein